MTEPVVAAGAVAPAAVPPSAPVVTPSAAGEPPEPQWLPSRLARERSSLLRDLGYESADAAKTAIADLKKRQDAEKTETERLRGELATANTKAARADVLESVIKAKADAAVAALDPAKRAAVTALAGDDPARVLAAVEALTAFSAPAAPALVTPPAAPAPPAPIAPNTAPSATAPPAPTPGAVVSHRAQWEALKATNPMLAASYRLANYAALEAESKTTPRV